MIFAFRQSESEVLYHSIEAKTLLVKPYSSFIISLKHKVNVYSLID